MNSIIVLSIAGLFSMITGLFNINKKLIMGVVIAALVISGGLLAANWNTNYSYFNEMLYFDNYALSFGVLLITLTLILFLLSEHHFEEVKYYITEQYSLVIFSLAGMLVIVSFSHMAMLFVGIEIMSIPLYILAGSKKKSLASNEASMKYFLMGSFATGLLLMGITLIYGETGDFHIEKIAAFLVNYKSPAEAPLLTGGILLILAGLSFKVSAAPFHFWTPDVYQGSPSWITSFMSSAVKVAGFAAFFRLFYACFLPAGSIWVATVSVMAILTISIGSITAVFQSSMKRIMAYSSVSHAGYMMIVLFTSAENSAMGLLFYGLAYSVSSIVAFAVIMAVQKVTNSDEVDAFNGLAKSNPLLALLMTLSMLSLAGIPLTGGFFAKFFILSSGVEAGYLWIVIIAIINAIIGIYYYFKVIIAMYFKDDTSNSLTAVSVSGLYMGVLVICSLITLQLGIFPDLLYYFF